MATVTARRDNTDTVDVEALSILIEACHQEQAEETAGVTALAIFPLADGWYRHRITVRPVPVRSVVGTAGQFANYAYLLAGPEAIICQGLTN